MKIRPDDNDGAMCARAHIDALAHAPANRLLRRDAERAFRRTAESCKERVIAAKRLADEDAGR